MGKKILQFLTINEIRYKAGVDKVFPILSNIL